jgi:hypothetical protein
MFIVIIPPLDPRSSGAQCLRAAATSGSAGAVINCLGRGYKHLFPPGPRQCSSNTLLPHYVIFYPLLSLSLAGLISLISSRLLI